jgi:hypothetical protein
MLNPTLEDGPAEIALMNDLQRNVLRMVYQANSEGLRLWQVQKQVGRTKLEVQAALHELLAAGYVGILSMGGGPKYHKVTSKAYVLAALAAADAQAR